MSGPVSDNLEESKLENVVHLKMDNFNNKIAKNTVMFSTYEPEFIFAQLIGKLQDKDITPDVHSKKWKLTFDILRD